MFLFLKKWFCFTLRRTKQFCFCFILFFFSLLYLIPTFLTILSSSSTNKYVYKFSSIFDYEFYLNLNTYNPFLPNYLTKLSLINKNLLLNHTKFINTKYKNKSQYFPKYIINSQCYSQIFFHFQTFFKLKTELKNKLKIK